MRITRLLPIALFVGLAVSSFANPHYEVQLSVLHNGHEAILPLLKHQQLWLDYTPTQCINAHKIDSKIEGKMLLESTYYYAIEDGKGETYTGTY